MTTTTTTERKEHCRPGGEGARATTDASSDSRFALRTTWVVDDAVLEREHPWRGGGGDEGKGGEGGGEGEGGRRGDDVGQGGREDEDDLLGGALSSLVELRGRMDGIASSFAARARDVNDLARTVSTTTLSSLLSVVAHCESSSSSSSSSSSLSSSSSSSSQLSARPPIPPPSGTPSPSDDGTSFVIERDTSSVSFAFLAAIGFPDTDTGIMQ